MNTKNRKEQCIKQLIIETPEKLHNKIKAHVALRNISMRKWVIRTLLKALKDESGG